MKSPTRSNLSFSLLVTVLVASLGYGVAGIRSFAPDAALDATPRFFDWNASGAIEGSYLVMFEPEPVTLDGRLVEDAGSLYINPTAGDVDSAAVDEIQRALGGLEIATADATLAGLVADPRVESVDAIGFDTYLVTTDMDPSELAAMPGVSGVAPDVGLVGASADELFPLQWPLENMGVETTFATAHDADVDAPRAWHRARGAGVTVAVIDSGVDVTHPDLASAIWTNAGETCGNGVDDDGNGYVDDCHGWNFRDGTADVDDQVGHGTHVAGIIAADADNGIGIAGIAYESTIMPLKVGDGSPTLSAAVEAFAYAIDNGARVINASWVTAEPGARRVLGRAIVAARKAGVLVVAGAGNDAANLATNPVYPAAIDAPNMITVAATTAVDGLAAFSNTGRPVDVAAPGEHVVSTVPGGYGVYSGTSMAAPHVAAAAALLWSAEPTATVQDVVHAIVDRADRPASLAGSIRGGRLNIGAAVEARKFAPSLSYTFVGFDAFQPGEVHDVSIRAALTDPWVVPPQTPARYRVAVLAAGESGPMAVNGLSLTTDGGVVTTDETGRAFVGEEFIRARRRDLVRSFDATDLSLRLPAGTYAMVFDLVDLSDPSSPSTLGDPSAVFFTVGLETEAIPFPIDAAPAPADDDATTDGSASDDGDTTASTAATSGPADPPQDGPPETLDPVGGPGPDPDDTTIGDGGAATPELNPDAGTEAGTDEPQAPDLITPSTTAPPATASPTSAPATATPRADAPDDPADTGSAGGAGLDTGTAPVDGEDDAADTAATIGLVRVNPDNGATGGGTTVTVVGEIPANPLIEFGSAQSRLVTVGDGYAVVETAAHDAGVVDVVVTDGVTGSQGVLTGAFTYSDVQPGEDPVVDDGAVEVDEDAPQAPDPDDPTAVDPEPVAGPEEADGSGEQPDDSQSADDPTPADPEEPVVPETSGPVAEDDVPISAGGGFGGWLDAALVTPEGLDLVPLSPDDPLAGLNLFTMAGQRCTTPECPGWVLPPGFHHPTDPRTGDHQNGSGKVNRNNGRDDDDRPGDRGRSGSRDD